MVYRIPTDRPGIQPHVHGKADQARKRGRTTSSLVHHVHRPHADGEHRNRAFRSADAGTRHLQRDAEAFLGLARRRDDVLESTTYAPGPRLASGSAAEAAKRRGG